MSPWAHLRRLGLSHSLLLGAQAKSLSIIGARHLRLEQGSLVTRHLGWSCWSVTGACTFIYRCCTVFARPLEARAEGQIYLVVTRQAVVTCCHSSLGHRLSFNCRWAVVTRPFILERRCILFLSHRRTAPCERFLLATSPVTRHSVTRHTRRASSVVFSVGMSTVAT